MKIGIENNFITVTAENRRESEELIRNFGADPEYKEEVIVKKHKKHKKHIFIKVCPICNKEVKGLKGLVMHSRLVHEGSLKSNLPQMAHRQENE